MQSNYPHIALLLFTRTPEEEVRAKVFVPNGNLPQQLAVAGKLIEHSQYVLAATGLNYFTCFSADQAGRSFGERLHAAFADLFSCGYEQVITIGNDCPQLQPADILLAVQKLQEKEVVVGPDTSGGVYLLGMSRNAFNQCTSFKNIRWRTDWMLSDLATLCQATSVELAYLKKYADIDNCRDFRNACQKKLFRPQLQRFFRRLFGTLTAYSPDPDFHVRVNLLTSILSFRGPPSWA